MMGLRVTTRDGGRGFGRGGMSCFAAEIRLPRFRGVGGVSRRTPLTNYLAGAYHGIFGWRE
jgi:hypothetical protein